MTDRKNRKIDVNLQKKRGLAKILALLPVLALSGCAAGPDGYRLALDEQSAEADRLAGVFVTSDYIEPSLPSLKLNIQGEIVAEKDESEKIYGTLNGFRGYEPVVIFPDLEGYGIYNLWIPEDVAGTSEAAWYSTCDFLFSNLQVNVSDEKDSMEADLYVSSDSFAKYYFNPVYQQADGQIYLLAGSGISTNSFVDGQKFSHSISESVSRTENGKQSTQARRFTVNIVAAGMPEDADLLLMDEKDQVLTRYNGAQLEEFALAGALTLPPEASYLILKQSAAGREQNSLSVFDRNAESLEYLTSAGNGYLYYHQIPLTWP